VSQNKTDPSRLPAETDKVQELIFYLTLSLDSPFIYCVL